MKIQRKNRSKCRERVRRHRQEIKESPAADSGLCDEFHNNLTDQDRLETQVTSLQEVIGDQIESRPQHRPIWFQHSYKTHGALASSPTKRTADAQICQIDRKELFPDCTR